MGGGCLREEGRVFEEVQGGDEDPICVRSPSAGSAEERQGRERALNLAVTLKLITSGTSPSRAALCFICSG